jgi:hypothetical protein
MTAHWVVLAAAALTTLVAAAVGAALAVFAGQALPQAVRHDLTVAPGTSLAAVGTFGGGDAQETTAALRSAIGGALSGVPFTLWSGVWSDPLGFVNASLPAKPATVSAGTTPLLQAAAFDGVTGHAVLVAGSWPVAPGASGAIPAALPATTAALLQLHVGDVLGTEDRNTNTPVSFRITGLYAERQLSGAAGAYWELNSVPASGASTAGGFITYGPLVVAPAAFPGRLAEASGTWVAQPDMAAFTGGELAATAAAVTALQDSLNSSNSLNGLQVTSSLPAVLAGIGNNLTVARSLLAISGLQLLVLTVAALLAVARLLAAQREAETALLTARGATRWQLIRLTATEVIPLAVVCALGGGVAGVWLARLLADTLFSSLSPSGGIDVTAAGTWLDALAAALAIAVVAIGAMLFPVLRAGQPGAVRVRRGRQAMLASAARSGADLALIALAVLAGWQLRQYSAVSTSASGTAAAIDPVLALAPAIALAGGTVLTLRLLPAAARVADRLAAGGRRLTAALAGWQFSRQPLRQGGAAMLLVMAVATGTLALAQHQSWSRSASDQAAFTAGADVRVNLAAPLGAGDTTTITRASGVQNAMAVAPIQVALPSQVLAIDSAQASKVVLMRSDEAALPSAALFTTIAPGPATGGVAIPGTPSAVTLTAALSPAPLGTVTAVFTVTDAAGDSFQLAATGSLPADGKPHLLTAPLGGTGAAYPLRLTQVTLSYTLPAKPLGSVTLTVNGARPSTWLGVASSEELSSQLASGDGYGPTAEPGATGWHSVPGGAALTFNAGYGQVTPNPAAAPPIAESVDGQVTLTATGAAPSTVPAIATSAFIDSNKTGVGDIVSTTIGGVTVPARIVAVASAFPTVTGSALIMDLPTLQAFLASNGGAPLSVTQWWLATTGGQVPASLTRALPPGAAVTSSAALTAAATADPLSAAPQQALLAVAAAAALLAITGFWVSIAADVRQRRAENALLAALGVAQRSAAAQLFIEKLLLSVPAAALGLVLGTVVARLLVPAVTLTTTAQRPVPPPVTLFDLPQTVPLALAVAVIPALAAALVVFRRPDPAAELRAAEAA